MIKLRDYQAAAVDATAAHLRDGGRAQVHMACGTGKTVVCLRVAELVAPGDSLVVVLVPSIALTDQMLRSWRADAEQAFSALAVCSDQGVVDDAMHVADLTAGVTIDVDDISHWLRSTTGRRVVVGTYTSAWAVAAALRTTGVAADLLVCDEAHHLTGRLDIEWSQVLSDDYLPADRRLHATATPRFDLRVADPDGMPVAGMDDEDLFGAVTGSYPLHQAIAEGVVKDYRLVVMAVSEHEARSLLHDPEVDYLEGVAAAPLPVLAAQVALSRAQRRFGLRRVISFHGRIDAAAQFATTLRSTLRRLPEDTRATGDLEPTPVLARHVHGRMPTAARKRVLDHLRHPPADGWAVVANARCLSEGVDVPAVDGVVFASAKSSTVDIVQAIGRAVRRSPGGVDVATVIVPIVVPDPVDGQEVSALDPGRYAHLWDTLRSLRAHDEQIGAALDQVRSLGEITPRDIPDRISVVLAPGMADHVLEQITVALVKATTSPWWEAYGAAARFHSTHGHLRVPPAYRDPHTGLALSSWVTRQRAAAHAGHLPADRRAHLDTLGMSWDLRGPGLSWDQAYAIAARHHAEHGTLDMPTHHTVDGLDLWYWLIRQRHRHGAGDLSTERIRLLDKLDMRWKPADDPWDLAYEVALSYHSTHGHLRVPASYADPDSGIRLGAWIRKQRDRHDQLPAQRRAQLDALGMAWAIDFSKDRWLTGLKEARHHHAQHGHLDVPKGHVTDTGFQLGDWLGSRRLENRRGALAADRVATLDALGMIWDPTEQRWRDSYTAAQEYYAQHGHLDVPHKHATATGIRLGSWVLHQRQLRSGVKPGGISAERIRLLDKLGMRWSSDKNRTMLHRTGDGR